MLHRGLVGACIGRELREGAHSQELKGGVIHSKVMMLKMLAVVSGMMRASSIEAFGGGGVFVEVNGTRNNLQTNQRIIRRGQ